MLWCRITRWAQSRKCKTVIWKDVGAALALVLVFEGILPFLNPQRFRESLKALTQIGDRALRLLGAASMLGGVILLYGVRI